MHRPNFYGRITNVFIHHMQYFIYMVMSLLWSIKTKNVFTVLFQRSLIRTKQNKFIFNIIFFLISCLRFLHTGLIKLNQKNSGLKDFLRLNFPEGLILQITSEQKYSHYTMAFLQFLYSLITFSPTKTLNEISQLYFYHDKEEFDELKLYMCIIYMHIMRFKKKSIIYFNRTQVTYKLSRYPICKLLQQLCLRKF